MASSFSSFVAWSAFMFHVVIETTSLLAERLVIPVSKCFIIVNNSEVYFNKRYNGDNTAKRSSVITSTL